MKKLKIEPEQLHELTAAALQYDKARRAANQTFDRSSDTAIALNLRIDGPKNVQVFMAIGAAEAEELLALAYRIAVVNFRAIHEQIAAVYGGNDAE